MKLLVNVNSVKWLRSIIYINVLICLSGCSVLRPQHDKNGDVFAVILSKNIETGKEVKAGAKIFADKDYVFEQLPGFLRGTDYLETFISGANHLIPITEGYVYMVTPLTGYEGSQEQQLMSMGFEKTPQQSFLLFKEQKGKIGVFKKYFGFEKFRLGHLNFDGWAVPFFKDRLLPSVSIPAEIIWMPGEEYAKDSRKWQGCPTVEITGNRLWGGWFSGGNREPDTGNYGIISYSDDKESWIDPAMIIFHPDSNVRVMDTQLWKDPDGRLWVFWTQNYGRKGFDGLWGTWAISSENPEAEIPTWSEPRRIGDGLSRNKPIVLSGGEWLLPSYNWINHQSAVYISTDKGQHWKLQGGPINTTVDNFYEHICVELQNGDIWMLQRNIQSSISKDKGVTWSALDTLPSFTSANSRLFLGRLQSGRLLLIYNNDVNGKRKNLTAFLSDDDGKSWPLRLVLDERDNVSYPDVVQDSNNRIYVTYDRSRTGAKEILMASFTEEDILKGEFISPFSEKKKIISKAGK